MILLFAWILPMYVWHVEPSKSPVGGVPDYAPAPPPSARLLRFWWSTNDERKIQYGRIYFETMVYVCKCGDGT